MGCSEATFGLYRFRKKYVALFRAYNDAWKACCRPVLAVVLAQWDRALATRYLAHVGYLMEVTFLSAML